MCVHKIAKFKDKEQIRFHGINLMNLSNLTDKKKLRIGNYDGELAFAYEKI